MRRTPLFIGALGIALGLFALAGSASAQDTAGRVFLPTTETIAIYEFNDLPGVPGDAVPSGTVIPDLSGNGLNATAEGTNDNSVNELVMQYGDGNFDSAVGDNKECQRVAYDGTTPARLAVNNDANAFEMEATDDFSIELYVNREDSLDAASWGVLAGTWHSRNLIDDSVGDPDNNGAWYGYGLIHNPWAFGEGNEGWGWVVSPVVGGVPRIGFGQGPEVFLLPFFAMATGRHYVVLSVDRVAQTAKGYVDGAEVSTLALDPTWTFTTPPGRDHARFLMFNGENDSTLNTWMTSATGMQLDAVRVQRKALTSDDILQNYDRIQMGEPSPPPSEIFQAVLVAGQTDVLVDQCVLMNGSGSFPGQGNTITKWEWKVGAGAFEEGGPTREVSIPTASPLGTLITLQITNSASKTTSASVHLSVRKQEAVAKIAVKLGDTELKGDPVIVPKGSVLTLDGTGSTGIVPADAFVCPLSNNDPLPPSPITAYAWDLTSDGTTDNATPGFDTPALNTVEAFKVTLKVTNEAGSESTASVNIQVSDSGGNSDVFHNTDDTIFHLELNEEAVGPVADQTVFPDLSDSLADLTVLDPVGASIEVEDGAGQFTDNRALNYLAGGNGPRGEVLNDNDVFEMDETEDFTFEIYVRPGEATQPQWGDVAGTFRARTNGEESARYGWGIIKSHLDDLDQNLGGYMWFVCYGDGGAAEKKVEFYMQQLAYNYVACTVDRTNQVTKVYVNGNLAGQLVLDPTWTFVTPEGYPHANFFLFTREQVDDQYSNCVVDTAVDAVRVQSVALTAEQVADNWKNIAQGLGADPSGEPPPKQFRRGDSDGKGGVPNITDGIFVLNFLFLGGPEPPCKEAADADNKGGLNITDGIYILNYLFQGGPAPPAPGPDVCGPDTDVPGSPGDLGCELYDKCGP